MTRGTGPDESHRWQDIVSLLDTLLDADTTTRAGVLGELESRDPSLANEVRQLLEADQRPSGILDTPPPAPSDAAPPTPSPPAWIGTRVGVYRLTGFLGRGGMGEVYRAERDDGEFEHEVAIKTIRVGMGTEENVERFRQERQILARLTHPAITRLLDGGVTPEGQPYLVMELVDGSPLVAHARTHNLPQSERLRLFEDVCAAVGYAHRHLVVHRDLKPSNVLVTPAGAVKLLDFGIAKLISPDADPGMTRVGTFVLTPEYAAPEQLRDEPVTTATDVFALGVILYELLAGTRPHRAVSTSRRDLERAILEADADPLPASVDRDLALIVARALAKEPDQRYPTADALRDDLRRHRDGLPIMARMPSFRYRTGKFIRRHRVPVIAASLVVLATLVGLVGTTWQAQVARREAARAMLTRDLLLEIFSSADPNAAPGTLSATDVLRRGMTHVDERLEGDPELRAEMLHTIGHLLNELGDPEAAQGLLSRAVELRLLHGSSGEQAESLDELATSALYLDRYTEAESLYTLALQTLGGEADRHRARTLNNLAVTLSRQGRYEESVELHRQAIRLDRARYGDEHVEVATDLSNLAVVYQEMGRVEEADSLHRAVLAMRRRLYPGERSEIAASLHNIAEVARLRSDLPEAESFVDQAIAMKRRIFDPGHPSLVTSLRLRGGLLANAGRLDEADEQLQSVLAISLERGEESVEIANAHNELGVLAYQRGDLTLACQRIESGLAIFEALLGPDHATVGTVTANLATLERLQGNVEQAEVRFRRVLAIHRAQYGSDHSQIVLDLNNLGAARRDLGDAAGAVAYHREALAMALRLWGDEAHSTTAASQGNLGRSLYLAGEYPEAEAHLTRSLAYATEHLPPGSPRTIAVRTALGRVWVALGRSNEALELLQGNLIDATRENGPEHSRTAQVLAALGECQLGLGRSEDAIATLTQAHRILEASHGPDHPDTRDAVRALARAGGAAR